MDQVTVIVEDDPTPISLPEAAVNYFELVKEMSVISNDAIKLNIQKDVFNKMIEFGELNNFEHFKVATVKTNNLKLALEGDDKNYKFISQFKGGSTSNCVINSDPELAKLFKAAEYIKCDPLMSLIAVVVACELYFGDSME